jgi:hypothetical protein
MARRKYTPEQIIGILRQVEVAVSNGRSTAFFNRRMSLKGSGRQCGKVPF